MHDLEAVHHLHSFPEVDEFNTLGVPANIEETRQYLNPLIRAQKDNPRKLYLWKVTLLKTSEFTGIAGMTLSDGKFKRGELYYKILPDYWGHGYATEIGQLLVQIGFTEFGLHRVEAGVATENVRSIRVLEKLGMTREGRHRKILPIRGEWKDNYRYAIVEDDPRGY